MNHPTMQQILDYIDGLRENAIELHIRTCADCRTKIHAVSNMERAIRQFPFDEPSAEFTLRLIRRLGIRKSVSLGWIIARNLAPVIALSFIVVVLVLVFKVTGTFAGSNIGEPVTISETFVTSVNNSISAGVSSFSLWLEKFFPFAFSKQNYGFTALVVVVLGVVAMLDKFVFAPIWRKRME
jgi:hypothetical protein